MRILDVGCGPGSITVGLASATQRRYVLGVDIDPGQIGIAKRAASGSSSSTVDFAACSVYQLAVSEASFDAVFAHGLFEHLAHPDAALTELFRVIRPGGVLALASSDWSRAQLRPRTANVDASLRGHYLLRRRAGGDPFAGKRLAGYVVEAGFSDVRSHARYRSDMSYRELACYVETRLAAAVSGSGGDREQLASAARSARVWAQARNGDFTQCWVEVTAVR